MEFITKNLFYIDLKYKLQTQTPKPLPDLLSVFKNIHILQHLVQAVSNLHASTSDFEMGNWSRKIKYIPTNAEKTRWMS
jgi:hypothetical protein